MTFSLDTAEIKRINKKSENKFKYLVLQALLLSSFLGENQNELDEVLEQVSKSHLLYVCE